MLMLRPPADSGRGRLSKSPSPILIPGRPNETAARWLARWVRGLLSWSKNDKAAQSTAALDSMNLDPTPPGAAPESEDQSTENGTIQMLPGRLEPLIPEVIQQEIRFEKALGEEQEVTIGWEIGDPPHHVTLDHPSIQPLHAKMTFQKGKWMIESLAPNDPVEINGTPVPHSAGPYLLAAGDQVRIGEALFRFFLP